MCANKNKEWVECTNTNTQGVGESANVNTQGVGESANANKQACKCKQIRSECATETNKK